MCYAVRLFVGGLSVGGERDNGGNSWVMGGIGYFGEIMRELFG